MNNIILGLLAACIPVLNTPDANAAPDHAPARIIFDTEMSSDCDSAGALAVLNHLADLGEAQIDACVADAVEPDLAIAATMSAINTYYGRPRIPIGTYQSTVVRPGKSHYTALIRDNFPQHMPSDDKAPHALDVYRATLAAAPDGSVTIVSLGFLVNLRDLLESKPDAASPLTGSELARKKVKLLVAVGGYFPHDNMRDRKLPEYNFGGGSPLRALDTQFVVEHWPTAILFSGAELAQGICTGPTLVKTGPANPVRRIYELNGAMQNGRSSWCQTAVLAAVRDPALYWEVKSNGYCVVTSNGQSTWTPELHRGHSYLATKVSQPEMARIIGEMMAAPPIAAVKSSH
jgi:hypothetical protein